MLLYENKNFFHLKGITKIKVFKMKSLALLHVTLGIGVPSTLHRRVTVCPILEMTGEDRGTTSTSLGLVWTSLGGRSSPVIKIPKFSVDIGALYLMASIQS